MIINNCYKEIFSLNLDNDDKIFLSTLVDRYAEKANPVQGRNPDGTLRPVFHNYKDFYIHKSEIDYSDNILFRKIEKTFNGYKDLDYIYKRFHIAVVPGPLPYHIDKRECAFTIPFKPVKYPITWVDDNYHIIGFYNYENPVLVNTKIKHGCLQNDEMRILFQVGFDEPFNIVKSIIPA